MTPEELAKRLRLGEDSDTEFKQVVGTEPSNDVLAAEICAFANSGGGHLLLGVADDGSVTGIGSQQESEALQIRVTQVCSDRVEPPLTPRLTLHEVEGQRILLVAVPGYLPSRPFRAGSKFFVRDGPRKRQARTEELRDLFSSVSKRHLDEEPIDGATLGDLDLALADELFRRVSTRYRPADRDRYLQHHHFINDEGVPTYGGVLVLGHEPTEFLREAKVLLVRYGGRTLSRDVRVRREFKGPLHRQVEETVDALRGPEVLEGLERTHQGFPKSVLREAVVNMLVHRDYGVASPSRVLVFDDRVELTNPGVLLNQLTVEGIQVGLTQRRNPTLVAALTSLGYAEGSGSGVPLMVRELEEAGYPSPLLSAEHRQFKLVLRADGKAAD